MYESFFQLSERPFQAAARADRLFAAASIDAARQSLARCIERAEGVGLLIGPAGTGKTLLLQVLAEQFRGKFSVALLTNCHLATRRALLQAILFELGLPYHGMDEGELRLSLIDYLSSPERSPRGMVLLIDEAHLLGLRLLEEVRMITNLVRNGEPRVRLVLAGAMALEERLASPRLEAFAQRVCARCYLGPLDKAETTAYVRAQIAAVGGNGESLFTADALAKLHAATDGIPRLVNQVCDHALVLAYAGNRTTIDGAGIEEAWADLQQLPMPTQEIAIAPKSQIEMVDAEQDDVIEFGSLEDDAIIEQEPLEAIKPRVEPTAQPVYAVPADEFEPAAQLGPEVELVFSGALDPFAESFDEEEVISDRYAGADEALRRAKPVYSAEGMQLSAMLEPFLKAAPEAIELLAAREEVATPSPPAEPPLRAFPTEAEPHTFDDVHDLDPADDPVMPEDRWEMSAVVAARGEMSDVAPPRTGMIEDTDIIVVEDDPAPAPRESLRGPTVRRQEYRQLFVKLRGN